MAAESVVNIPTAYFRKPGIKRTDAVFTLARQRMQELGIQKIVVASTRGYTGVRAVELLRPEFNVLVAIENTGFRDDHVPCPEEANLRLIEEKGGVIIRSDHALGGVGRAVRNELGVGHAGDLISHTLYFFGQGMKVAVEVAIMATDAGMLSPDEPAVTVGGTSRGCDTAIVVKPACAQNIFELRVLEIICMPSPDHPAWEIHS